MIRIRFATLLLVVAVLFAANILFGSVHLPVSEIADVLLGRSSGTSAEFIVLENRLPQACTALLAGATLAVAGQMLQTIFRNPLAGPSILGVSSGASLGVALLMLAGVGMGSVGAGGFTAITLGAFAGAFAVLGVLMFFAMWLKNNLSLLVAGIMVGYLASSAITILNYTATADSIRGYVMWGMGSFANVGLVRLPYFTVLCLLALGGGMLMAKPLNILSVGSDYARSLGLNVALARRGVLAATGLAVAAVTAFCGPVGFLGLATPHITMLLFRRSDHRALLPGCMLCGAALALGCNLICVLPGRPLPLNAVTPFVGIPVILWLLLRRQ